MKKTKKIILMNAVITLIAIMTTSCIVGFQSAQVKVKYKNQGVSEAELTLADNDYKFTMNEIKWKTPSGETKNHNTHLPPSCLLI